MTYITDAIALVSLAWAVVAFLFIGAAMTTPCPAEDDTWCIWDASSQGNGVGESSIRFGPVWVPTK